MQRMTDKEIIEVVQAHIDGKEIECSGGDGIWRVAWPSWNFESFIYRVKPELPKPVLVPWTIETCPIGGIVREKEPVRDGWRMIVELRCAGLFASGVFYSYAEALAACEWKPDYKSDKWLPCGTEVK